ncbi:GntR family transcriptional regulator [Bosea sp. RAF48]|jgi:DNA-binding GntR family transcriptional regulator|uniref:GntR family transcriptional regulator n=1 Tax=Bosea sp. RAF48 TaxID=3237480 RepID=UPI003F908521
MTVLKRLASRHPLASGESAAAQLLRVIRDAVVRLDIAPGERLSEQDIADAFGLSRHPVRNALLQLRDTGLIRSLPQKATQVQKISIPAVEAACFVREALECAAARRASMQATAAVLKELRYCVALQKTAAESNEIQRFMRLDDEFHRLVITAAGFELAWKIVDDHRIQIDRIRYLKLRRAEARDPSYANLYNVNIGEHEAILDAVASGDADRAEALTRRHTTKLLDALPILLEQHAEMFEPIDLDKEAEG